jgi:hypothetical protein
MNQLAQAMPGLAARLQREEAAEILSQALAKTTNLSILSQGVNSNYPCELSPLAEGVSILAARLAPQEAARFCGEAAVSLMQAQAMVTVKGNGDAALTSVLSADPPGLSRRWAAMLICAGPLASCGCPSATPATLGLALAPPPCRLTTPQLVELLKKPTCVGRARRVILEQLQNRYQRPFADQWAFVHFAQEENLGLDFTAPPKRLPLPAEEASLRLP